MNWVESPITPIDFRVDAGIGLGPGYARVEKHLFDSVGCDVLEQVKCKCGFDASTSTKYQGSGVNGQQILGNLLMALGRFNPELLAEQLQELPSLKRALDNGLPGVVGSLNGQISHFSQAAEVLGQMCVAVDSVESMRWLLECGGDAAGVHASIAQMLKGNITPSTPRTLEQALSLGSVRMWRLLHEAYGPEIFWHAGMTASPETPRVFDLMNKGRSDVLALWLQLDPTLMRAKHYSGASILERARTIAESDDNGRELTQVILSAQARQAAGKAIRELDAMAVGAAGPAADLDGAAPAGGFSPKA